LLLVKVLPLLALFLPGTLYFPPSVEQKNPPSYLPLPFFLMRLLVMTSFHEAIFSRLFRVLPEAFPSLFPGAHKFGPRHGRPSLISAFATVGSLAWFFPFLFLSLLSSSLFALDYVPPIPSSTCEFPLRASAFSSSPLWFSSVPLEALSLPFLTEGAFLESPLGHIPSSGKFPPLPTDRNFLGDD